MLCYDIQYDAMQVYAIMCYILLWNSMLCKAIIYYEMLCYDSTVVCYALLWYGILCYGIQAYSKKTFYCCAIWLSSNWSKNQEQLNQLSVTSKSISHEHRFSILVAISCGHCK